MATLREYLALVKIGIVGSNALTAAAGFALAAGWARTPLPLGKGALVLAGTSLLVGGACAVNNWLDRDIDALMPRTRSRPTATGAMGAREALGIGAALLASGLALLLWAGPVAAAIGLAATLVYLLPYTLWTKRRGVLSLYVGGVAGALPPLIGWAALRPSLGWPALALFALLAIWQQAHVRALALRRADEYRRARLPMAGLSSGEGLGSGAELPGSRAAVLVWAGLALPFPGLAIVLAGLPLEGAALAVALASCALDAAWVGWGLVGLRSKAWPGRMFAASLAYLVLIFAALIAVGV